MCKPLTLYIYSTTVCALFMSVPAGQSVITGAECGTPANRWATGNKGVEQEQDMPIIRKLTVFLRWGRRAQCGWKNSSTSCPDVNNWRSMRLSSQMSKSPATETAQLWQFPCVFTAWRVSTSQLLYETHIKCHCRVATCMNWLWDVG